MKGYRYPTCVKPTRPFLYGRVCVRVSPREARRPPVCLPAFIAYYCLLCRNMAAQEHAALPGSPHPAREASPHGTSASGRPVRSFPLPRAPPPPPHPLPHCVFAPTGLPILSVGCAFSDGGWLGGLPPTHAPPALAVASVDLLAPLGAVDLAMHAATLASAGAALQHVKCRCGRGKGAFTKRLVGGRGLGLGGPPCRAARTVTLWCMHSCVWLCVRARGCADSPLTPQFRRVRCAGQWPPGL